MPCIHFAAAMVLLLAAASRAQDPSAESSASERTAGVDPESHIAYALISTRGRLLNEAQPAPTPRLTAQCTQDPAGKRRFELLADFGGVAGIAFYPPWKPSSPSDLFPPRLQRVVVTMEFLGYTRVKPVKRQWELLEHPGGELRYATPGLSSTNMESITFYLQYLRALPTLRLTAPGKGTAEFETANWQQRIKAEPVCAASGL